MVEELSEQPRIANNSRKRSTYFKDRLFAELFFRSMGINIQKQFDRRDYLEIIKNLDVQTVYQREKVCDSYRIAMQETKLVLKHKIASKRIKQVLDQEQVKSSENSSISMKHVIPGPGISLLKDEVRHFGTLGEAILDKVRLAKDGGSRSGF